MTIYDAAQIMILLWLGAICGYGAFHVLFQIAHRRRWPWLRRLLSVLPEGKFMRQKPVAFDPDNQEHMVELTCFIQSILINRSGPDIHFALLLWRGDCICAVMSNDTEPNHVVEMLDDAKMRIITPNIHPTAGHA